MGSVCGVLRKRLPFLQLDVVSRVRDIDELVDVFIAGQVAIQRSRPFRPDAINIAANFTRYDFVLLVILILAGSGVLLAFGEGLEALFVQRINVLGVVQEVD